MSNYNFKLKIAIATSFLQDFYENTLIFFFIIVYFLVGY